MARNGAVRKGIYLGHVKEKYGQLRLEAHGAEDARVDELLQWAQREAAQTCMACGRRGQRLENGWIIVSCNSCAAARR